MHKINTFSVSEESWKGLRACELMRSFAESCGAENPQTLRGTVLRKHIATIYVNFNLTEIQMSDLANFLGHADKIHKENYRQPIIWYAEKYYKYRNYLKQCNEMKLPAMIPMIQSKTNPVPRWFKILNRLFWITSINIRPKKNPMSPKAKNVTKNM